MEIYLGLITGLAAAFIASIIAYIQQLPKWQKQGFSIAKTPEEKQIVRNYYADPNYKKITSTSYLFPIAISSGVFATAVVAILNSYIKGLDLRPLLAIGGFLFVPFLFLGIYISALISDKKIRASKR